ncbi:hypothetical protein O9X98_33980 [Agrobacterium salinitolerans]|nr:hypothetical protein [Agrobacterium salinitolerans]
MQREVDVAALSPLLRGMLLSVAYADGEGGIGLTATLTVSIGNGKKHTSKKW